MSTRQRIARRPRAGGSRPRYTWRYWESGESTLSAASSLTFILNTVGGVPDLSALGIFGDYTVRRLLGMVWAVSESGTARNSLDRFAWGVIIASRDAVLGGATPDPLSDAADWFAFGEGAVSLAGTGASNTIHPTTTLTIDSKAMRKVNENNQDVILRLEAPAGNFANVNILTMGRMLVSHGQR